MNSLFVPRSNAFLSGPLRKAEPLQKKKKSLTGQIIILVCHGELRLVCVWDGAEVLAGKNRVGQGIVQGRMEGAGASTKQPWNPSLSPKHTGRESRLSD